MKDWHISAPLIVTVALLSPSAGLMTLPIPDNEPDAAAIVVLADASHVGKRFLDDGSRIAIDAISPARESLQIAPIIANSVAYTTAPPLSTFSPLCNIRAPPRG